MNYTEFLGHIVLTSFVVVLITLAALFIKLTVNLIKN